MTPRERFLDHLTEAWIAAVDGGSEGPEEDYVVHKIGQAVDDARGDGYLLELLAKRVES